MRGASSDALAKTWLGHAPFVLTGTPEQLRALVEPKGVSVLELQPRETTSRGHACEQ